MAKRKNTANGKPLTTSSPKKKKKRKKKSMKLATFKSRGIPLLTLMDVPDREDLPPIPNTGRPCFLVQIVTESPDLYKQIITLIRHGVVGHVAAVRLGVNQNTFYSWCKQGKSELEEEFPPDTFYTRFYNDVLRAVATKRAELEMEIALTDPKKWLSHGPGRIFGDNWRDTPNNSEGIPHTLALEAPAGSKKATPDPDEDDVVEGEYVIVNEAVSLDALEELQNQGIIEVSRSYKSQVNKQQLGE
jgi:hypothetical protein